MSPRSIYIDFDDVLCHTIEALLEVLQQRHGRRVEREQVRHFDLQHSFGLSPAELAAFMERVHEPEVLLAMSPRAEVPGVLRRWAEAGHLLHVVTGRPASTAPPSRAWLERHALPFETLQFVDKYGREPEESGSVPLEALASQRFDLVVEDSLSMACFAVERWDVPVALIDQPWNREVAGLPARLRDRIVRCRDWEDVARSFPLHELPAAGGSAAAATTPRPEG